MSDSEKLKPCPCGKIPKSLCIEQSNTVKWALVSGSCCGEWIIQFRTKYYNIDSKECMYLAIADWNTAPRAGGQND